MTAIQDILGRFRREKLLAGPTPVQRLRRLEAAAGGSVSLYIKRDDLSTPLGGSKRRYLEFVLGAYSAAAADCIVHCGGPTSNYMAQIALLGAEREIPVHLAIQSGAAALQGNTLLASLYGAQLRWIGNDACDAAKRAWASELASGGRRPFVIEAPFANHSAILGFLAAYLELQTQIGAEACPAPTHIIMCSAGNSYLGLRLGAALTRSPCRIVAFSPVRFGDTTLTGLAAGRAEFLARKLASFAEAVGTALPSFVPEVSEAQVGPGYPEPGPAALEAVREVARCEGILLDPVYTGKAMAGCLAMIRRGEIPAGSRVLFWHSGAAPNVFRYADALAPSQRH